MTKSFLGAFRRLSAGDWLPLLCRAQNPRSVAITFDDGPSPDTTPLILDLLKRHRATATFFLTGARAEAFPDLTRRIAAEGHPVYSHGYDHIRADERPPASLRADLARTEEILSRIRRTPSPYLVRLPYASGHASARVHRTVGAWRHDARFVHWRLAFNDAGLAGEGASEEELRERCVAAVSQALADPAFPGSVLLLHECPIGLDVPLAVRVGPVLLEILLEKLDDAGLSTSGIGQHRSLPVVGRYVRTVAV